ncbi:Type I phosphodiesterase / nucleotide pyrophosphatase [Planctomycetes bacterium Poly30]|uniref:Type I phosphodiesterase / nucleotide pyrophosphatase n=1 Tax=Saltatorellus ferox TaxID=2528018 RepID=A0A518EZ71_9BACT|nr:Type I phosphodiesterase / nucleotide pyrophosphatase [Planctomycetes bacterium Poly30]
MILPRWTAYVALAVIAILFATAIPRRSKEADPHAARAARETGHVDLPESEYPRMVVIGIDGLDPDILRDVMRRFPDRMKNFQRLADAGGGVMDLGTSTPPQSPVAWSNFITGRHPGGHGIYDFIHRDKKIYRAIASTVVSEDGHDRDIPLTPFKLPVGGSSEPNRTGKAFWTMMMDKDVPADLYRVPINFPVEPSKGVSFSGMMTPALDSAYGQYTVYTTNPPAEKAGLSSRFRTVRVSGGAVRTQLDGPMNVLRDGNPTASVPLTAYLDKEANAAIIEVGSERLVMEPGQFSTFVRVSFDLLPAGAMSLDGIVCFYLRSISPEFELYASPVNFDPTNPVEPVSLPEDAAAKMVEEIGLVFTQGMAEDVNALKSEALTDAEFMHQANLVHRERIRILDYALDRYTAKKEGGLLFFYVSSVDLAMHMMWRHQDPQHPFYDPAIAKQDSSSWSGRDGTTWEDVVDDLYLRMDPILGKVLDRVGDDTTVMVMSDHGFAPYRRKFSLNTWLLENGYLKLKEGVTKELPEGDPKRTDVILEEAVDWSETRAYGIGFNGLYLNLAGREAEGIVKPGAEADALLKELKTQLELIIDQGQQVVLSADLASVVFAGGARLDDAPDIVVGYNSGYGNSDEATQGRIPHDVLTDNVGGTFNGSHLMHPSVVSGTLLVNRRVTVEDPRLEDLTTSILDAYDVPADPAMTGRPVLLHQ